MSTAPSALATRYSPLDLAPTEFRNSQVGAAFRQIVEAQIDADVEQVAVGINFRRETPLLPFELLSDLLFPFFQKPGAENQATVVTASKTMRLILKILSLTLFKRDAPKLGLSLRSSWSKVQNEG